MAAVILMIPRPSKLQGLVSVTRNYNWLRASQIGYRATSSSGVYSNSVRHKSSRHSTRKYATDSMTDEMPAKGDEWKARAPYRLYEPNEKFDAKLNASCHCGRVRYQLNKDKPLAAKYCHCTTCQSQHAAPFQWAAIFNKEDINFSRGHHDLTWYNTQEKKVIHDLPCKVRCNYCHSPIMDEGRNMILLFPSLIDLSDDKHKENFRPTCHMFYSQRVVDINDGTPKWSGIDEHSELIADSPIEMVREQERKRKRNDENDEKL